MMFRAMITIGLLLGCCVIPAGAGSIHAEWEYGGQADYYRIHINGRPLAKISLAAGAPLAADIVGVDPQLGDVFTMTAVLGVIETPHSAPFVIGVGTLLDKWSRTITLRTDGGHGRLSGGAPAILTPPEPAP